MTMRSTECPLFGTMWVIEDHLRPSGHIMPDHAGDRGAEARVLEPRDHLHIKQIRKVRALLASPRPVRIRMRTRPGAFDATQCAVAEVNRSSSPSAVRARWQRLCLAVC
jgi:hypothetical protein